MFKHANTFVPGDRVVRAGTQGKTAGSAGKVSNYDADSEKFEVEWPDGHKEWVKTSELEGA